MPFGYVAAAVSIAGSVDSAISSHNSRNAAENRANTIFNEQQGYAQRLQGLMDNPNQIKNDPGYQFNLNQGMDTVARSNAAGGFLNSGKAAAELFQFGEGYSMNFLGQQEKLLASLSGLSQDPNDSARTGMAANEQYYKQMGDMGASLGYMGMMAGGSGAGIGALFAGAA